MHFAVLPARFTISLKGDGDERNFWGGPSRGRQVGARVLAGGCAARRGARVASDADGLAANNSLVLRGYVRTWINQVSSEYDRIGLLDRLSDRDVTTRAA